MVLPYFHAFTQGRPDFNLYETDEDFVAGMNAIPLLLFRTHTTLLAAKLNDSHEHFVLAGVEEECRQFLREHVRHAALTAAIRQRRDGVSPAKYAGVKMSLLPITDPQSLRSRIAYVVKNAYDAGLPIAPWWDRWGCASAYFAGDMWKGVGCRIGDLGLVSARRRLLHSQFDFPEDWRVDEQYRIHPVWYTDHLAVERLFGRPETLVRYLASRSNAEEEEQIRTASAMEKSVQEYRIMAAELAREQLGTADLRQLSPREVVMLSRHLLRRGARYSQLQRIFGLSSDELRHLLR